MYESFYKLSAPPFQLNPDPAFFYGSREHAAAISYMRYAVYQGEGFLVVTGDIGAGKTTLVQALVEELDPRKVVAAQIVSTMLDADDLLRTVATAFGLPAVGVDKAQLLAYIETYLTSLVIEKKRALLLVDEAQNLSMRAMEELRMLSNFQFGARGLLQSFLVGQPELRSLLQSPKLDQLRQRVIASFHLRPLDSDETRHYIEHRLRHVGWNGDPAFTSGLYDVVFDATAGVPRSINAFCNRLLLAGLLGEKHILDEADGLAVMNEMKVELGPAYVRPPEAEPAGGAQSVAATPRVTQLNRIESTVNATLELLRTMVDPPPERRKGQRTGNAR
jgi:putative secretion ATPase (PEP-CTERM system associated)